MVLARVGAGDEVLAAVLDVAEGLAVLRASQATHRSSGNTMHL